MKSTKILGLILSATLFFGCSEDFLDKSKLGALSTDKSGSNCCLQRLKRLPLHLDHLGFRGCIER